MKNPTTLTSAFDYCLPPDRIAQRPLAERTQSRLLVAPHVRLAAAAGSSNETPASGSMLLDGRVCDLQQWLTVFLQRQRGHAPRSGRPALILINDSRVYPARVPVRRVRTLVEGGVTSAVGEVFLLGLDDERGSRAGEVFDALLRPQKKMRVGDRLRAAQGPVDGPAPEIFEVVTIGQEICQVRALAPALETVSRYGEVPLPPYIERHEQMTSGTMSPEPKEYEDRERYQTVYADTLGSAAAPTAGLHLTKELITGIQSAGLARFAPVTLHVGLGTFRPVQTEDVASHAMHAESYVVPQETASVLIDALRHGDPILYVGTTTFRATESFLRDVHQIVCHRGDASGHAFPLADGRPVPCDDRFIEVVRELAGKPRETSLFVYPGTQATREDYAPMAGHGIITNFHQPRSTLLMLVGALVGMERLREIYQHALDSGYRFLSYGDASLLGFVAEPRLFVTRGHS